MIPIFIACAICQRGSTTCCGNLRRISANANSSIAIFGSINQITFLIQGNRFFRSGLAANTKVGLISNTTCKTCIRRNSHSSAIPCKSICTTGNGRSTRCTSPLAVRTDGIMVTILISCTIAQGGVAAGGCELSLIRTDTYGNITIFSCINDICRLTDSYRLLNGYGITDAEIRIIGYTPC